ncbi:MAG: hypothetical protein ACJ73E_08915 [Mycobacteriales bacterium]
MSAPTAGRAREADSYVTRFGSLGSYQKGGVEIINDDPRHYAFSNVFEVAGNAASWERIAVGKNMKYVLEVVRAEGTSPWYTAAHDEFAVVLDGEVEITLVKPDESAVPPDTEGSVRLDGEPAGRRMGRVVARRGHMTLLPAGAAYRFTSATPGVVLMQTIAGPLTQFRWAEICQSL